MLCLFRRSGVGMVVAASAVSALLLHCARPAPDVDAGIGGDTQASDIGSRNGDSARGPMRLCGDASAGDGDGGALEFGTLIEISAGADTSCVRSDCGEVACWGEDLGGNSYYGRPRPIVVTGVFDAREV